MDPLVNDVAEKKILYITQSRIKKKKYEESECAKGHAG